MYPVITAVLTFFFIFVFQGRDKMMENLVPSVCAAIATVAVAIGVYCRTVGRAATDIYIEQLNAVEAIEKEADRLRAELAAPTSSIELIFEPDTVPYREEIRRHEPQVFIVGGTDRTFKGPPATFTQRIFRVCARNTGPDPFDKVAVLLKNLAPAVQRFNDVPLHQMHDNNTDEIYQQEFSLGAYDHKFVDVVFMNSTEKHCRLYHAAQHIDQQLPGNAYIATLAVKARGHKPNYYRFEIRVDGGELSFWQCPAATASST
jgi:hypothetical protein